MSVTREGWAGAALLAAASLAVLAAGGRGAALLPLALVPALLLLCRDPHRAVPPSPLGVLAPVDGRVVRVREDVHDPFVGRRSLGLVLRLQPWGPFTVRSPVEGRVMRLWRLRPGAAYPRPRGGARPAAPGLALWLRTDEGDDVVLALEGWALPARTRCLVRPGERLGQGQRCAFVYLPARVRLHLPANARLRVEAGRRVRAGEDILASLVHEDVQARAEALAS